MKISRKAPGHGTVRIALQSPPFLQLIIKTFIALLVPVVPQKLIIMPHLRCKKINKKAKEFLKKFHEMYEIFDQSDNLISCDYYGIPGFKKMKKREQQDLSILHLNVSSISAHVNDLRNFLNLVNQKIGIICISESRISTKNPQTTNIDLPGYNIEQTPTESSAGGDLIYISQSFSYKPRKDLDIYCAKELESVFIVLLTPN